MPTIDADAHVIETMETWAHLEGAEKRFTPLIVERTAGPETRSLTGREVSEFWVVDGHLMNKDVNIGVETTAETREMRDIDARLAHMDALGIDVQVLYPTLFLAPYTTNPEAELALCRSYNRWLADIWAKAPDRLRWVVAPPLLTMASVRDELVFAKEHGAVGVFMCGVENERMLSDPYFFPLYETAQELDLAICPHSASDSFAMCGLYAEDCGFNKFKLATIGAFHALLWHRVPARFPDLRWGFVEVSAQWLPYVLNDLGIRLRKRGIELPEDVLGANNIFVACQVTDDLPYILDRVSGDQLVIGTDYGHADTAAEIEALRKLRDDERLPAGVIDRILYDNPRRLYALG